MQTNYGLIAVVLLALIVLTAYFKDYAERPLSVDSEQVRLVIVPGTSFREVTRQLHEAGIISDRWSWDTFARIRGAAHEIKAGDYLLVTTLSPRQLLHKLVQGKVRNLP